MSSRFEAELQSVLADRAAKIQPGPPPVGLGATVRRRRHLRLISTGAAVVGVIGAITMVGTLTLPWQKVDQSATTGAQRWSNSADNLPTGPLSARRDVASAWTGSELLVWGGFSGNQAAEKYWADGAAYNPTSREWRQLPAAPLSARARMQAAWTGKEMIVWGGEDARHGDRGPVDGAAYNPETNTWRRISDAPGDGRSGAGTLMVGDKTAFFGGSNVHGASAATATLVYEPTADKWITIKTPRRVAAAAAIGTTLLFGELDDSGRLFVEQANVNGSTLSSSQEPLVGGPVERLGMLVAGDSAYVVVTEQNEATSVFSSNVVDGQIRKSWESIKPSDTLAAPNAVTAGYQGLITQISDDTAVIAALPEITLLNLRTGKVLLRDSVFENKGICGRSGALAWTGHEVLIWGGQTCRSTGATVTADGLTWTALPSR